MATRLDDAEYDSASDDSEELDRKFEELIKMRKPGANKGANALSGAKQLRGDLQTAATYVVSDSKKHKFNVCIGVFTVFLVVMFVAVLRAAIARSPIVFMKLAGECVYESERASVRASECATRALCDASVVRPTNARFHFRRCGRRSTHCFGTVASLSVQRTKWASSTSRSQPR